MPVRLVYGPDITLEAARDTLADAATALAPWGVQLRVTGAEATGLREAIGGEGDPLRATRALFNAYASPGVPPTEVVVAVLPHVLAPSTPAPDGQVIYGLTLTSTGEAAARELVADLRLRAPLAPVVALGQAELDTLDQPVAGAIVAHEIGHALGLTHAEAPEQLMTPGTPTCAGAIPPEDRLTLATAVRAMLRPRVIAGALVLLGGCADGGACAERPTLTVGLGADSFAPLTEGGPVPYELGPQGGHHVWGALKTTGVPPGNPSLFDDPSNPVVRFQLLRDGAPIGGFSGLPVPFNEDGIATGLQLFLTFTVDERTPGTPVTLSANLEDACGATAEATPAQGTLQPAL